MEPIRIKMPIELFSPAETAHFEEDASIDVLKIGPDILTFPKPVHWQADVTNTGDALLVTGEVEGVANCNCARCLEPMELEILGDIEGYFIISKEDEAPEDMEDDEFEFLPEDKTIDFAPLIQAAIVLDMPQIPLCSSDCKGICPKCGANLNESECGCAIAGDSDDAFEDASNPFSVLKNFDFGN